MISIVLGHLKNWKIDQFLVMIKIFIWFLLFESDIVCLRNQVVMQQDKTGTLFTRAWNHLSRSIDPSDGHWWYMVELMAWVSGCELQTPLTIWPDILPCPLASIRLCPPLPSPASNTSKGFYQGTDRMSGTGVSILLVEILCQKNHYFWRSFLMHTIFQNPLPWCDLVLTRLLTGRLITWAWAGFRLLIIPNDIAPQVVHLLQAFDRCLPMFSYHFICTI